MPYSAEGAGFEKAYGDSGTYMLHFTPVSDGGFVFIGYTPDSTFNHSAYCVIRVDSLGDTLWVKTYADAFPSFGRAIDTLPGGNLCFIGSHDGVVFQSLAEVFLTDASGNVINSNVYPPVSGWGSSGVGIVANSDTTAVVNIFYDGFLSDNEYELSRLNAGLSAQWTQLPGGDGSFMNEQSVVRDSADGYWAMIYYDFFFWNNNFYRFTNLKHYDSSGNLLLDSLYELDGAPTSLIYTDDGGVAISGWSSSGAYQELFLTRISPFGEILWRTVTRTPSTPTVGSSIIQMPDNGFVIAAAISDTLISGQRNILIQKFDSSGDSVWTHSYGTAMDDYPILIRRTTDQGMAVLGRTNGYGNAHAYFVKLDSLGLINTDYIIAGRTHNLCAGDSMYLTISPPPSNGSTVLWSTGETSDSILVDQTGNYSATINDSAGISVPEVFHVYVAPVPLVEFGPDSQSVCEGTELRSLVMQNDVSITYRWYVDGVLQPSGEGPSLVPQGAGWYELIASNYCGNSVDSVYVQNLYQQPLVPPIRSDGTVAVCPGDSLRLSIGQNDLSAFQWHLKIEDDLFPVTGANDSVYFAVQPGLFVLQAIDTNGCSGFTDPFPVLFDPSNEQVMLSGSNIVCEGQVVVLSLSAGTDYLWSTGDTSSSIIVDTSGFYFAQFNSIYGCPKTTDTVEIIINPLPEISLGPDTTLCSNQVYILSPGPGFTSYVWNNGSTSDTIIISTTAPFDSSTYWVSVVDSNGCGSTDSATVIFDLCTGEDQPELDKTSVVIYPNPVSGRASVTVLMPSISNYESIIYAIDGKVMDRVSFRGTTLILQVPYLAGSYRLYIHDTINRTAYFLRFEVN